MKNKLWLLPLSGVIVLLGLIIIFSSKTDTGSPGNSAATKKLNVVTSFYPLYYFATEIAGAKAAVYNITPAGAEPHEYEPTIKDTLAIAKADLIIINGLLEPWANKIMPDLEAKKIPVITATANLLLADFTDEGGKSVKDPHVWLSPRLSIDTVEQITTALIQIDARGADEYRARGQALIQKLAALENDYKNGLASCKQNHFVTSHAAFGYVAKDFGLTQIAIAGLSPEAEPSPKELGSVATFAKTNNIKYIFFESLVSPKLSETIANEVGATTLVLNPIEGLTDEDQKNGTNYFTEMRQNLANLRIALECQ